MAQQKRRPANDRAQKKYKANNQAAKNKKLKLEKHCKKYPKDEQAAKRLGEIIGAGYTYNKLPSKNKGITKLSIEKINELDSLVAPYNRKQPKIRPKPKMMNFIHTISKDHPSKTIEEQIVELFGIVIKDPKVSKNVRITSKPGRINVHSESVS